MGAFTQVRIEDADARRGQAGNADLQKACHPVKSETAV
jgi:hypothetical protein